DLHLELRFALVADDRDQPIDAPGHEGDRYDGEGHEDPEDAASDCLLDREARDRDHEGPSTGVPAIDRSRATSSTKRCSSEDRPDRTSWIRPPIPTMTLTSSGTRSGSIGRIDSRSST